MSAWLPLFRWVINDEAKKHGSRKSNEYYTGDRDRKRDG